MNQNVKNAILDGFRQQKAKVGHALNPNFFMMEFRGYVNTKEEEELYPTIEQMEKDGLIIHKTVNGYPNLLLERKGFEIIYPIIPRETIDMIKKAVLNTFKWQRAKAGHMLSVPIFNNKILNHLNPRESEYYRKAFDELVSEGLIEPKAGGALNGYTLTQTGFDSIYA